MIAYMPESYHAKQKIDNKIQDFYTFDFNPIAGKMMLPLSSIHSSEYETK